MLQQTKPTVKKLPNLTSVNGCLQQAQLQRLMQVELMFRLWTLCLFSNTTLFASSSSIRHNQNRSHYAPNNVSHTKAIVNKLLGINSFVFLLRLFSFRVRIRNAALRLVRFLRKTRCPCMGILFVVPAAWLTLRRTAVLM